MEVVVNQGTSSYESVTPAFLSLHFLLLSLLDCNLVVVFISFGYRLKE